MTDSVVISDSYRVPATAQRLEDGRIIIRTPGKPHLLFTVDEIDRLARFARDEATLQRFPMAPKTAPD
jgi:hypothetical protein